MTKAKVLCILNHKGGVGKTTTTINLGGALQQKGYKVLLIDLDGQANLTESMGLSAELPQTIYGAMKGEYPLPIYQHKDGMSVVPSCLDLSAVETELINEAGRELILAHLIKESKDKYDYILIDCPPSLSLLISLPRSNWLWRMRMGPWCLILLQRCCARSRGLPIW